MKHGFNQRQGFDYLHNTKTVQILLLNSVTARDGQENYIRKT